MKYNISSRQLYLLSEKENEQYYKNQKEFRELTGIYPNTKSVIDFNRLADTYKFCNDVLCDFYEKESKFEFDKENPSLYEYYRDGKNVRDKIVQYDHGTSKYNFDGSVRICTDDWFYKKDKRGWQIVIEPIGKDSYYFNAMSTSGALCETKRGAYRFIGGKEQVIEMLNVELKLEQISYEEEKKSYSEELKTRVRNFANFIKECDKKDLEIEYMYPEFFKNDGVFLELYLDNIDERIASDLSNKGFDVENNIIQVDEFSCKQAELRDENNSILGYNKEVKEALLNDDLKLEKLEEKIDYALFETFNNSKINNPEYIKEFKEILKNTINYRSPLYFDEAFESRLEFKKYINERETELLKSKNFSDEEITKTVNALYIDKNYNYQEKELSFER